MQFVSPVSYSEVCQAGPLIDSLAVLPTVRDSTERMELLVGTSQEGLFVVDPLQQTARDLPLYGPVKLLSVTQHLAVFVSNEARSRHELVLVALQGFDASTQYLDKHRIRTLSFGSEITSVAACNYFLVCPSETR